MLCCTKTGLLSAVALLSFASAGAQGAAVGTLIIGEIERITLNTPGDVWSGGRMVVGGHEVIIPRNLLMDLPANRLTLQQTFAGAPAACIARGESGLAKADTCNTSGLGGYATINANHTNSGDVIAGDVFLQKGTETESGVVSFINFTDGFFRMNGIPGSATTGVMVRFNDPVGRHSHQQGLGCAGGPNCSADPRFTNDPDNYTLVYTTGYPLCLPSTVPRPFTDVLDFNNNGNRNEVLVASSSATGTGDLLCPDTNRVVAAPHQAADSRRMAPLQLGDHLTVLGNFEIINGVRFFSAWNAKISRGITTSTAPGQPDYMFIDEMFIDGAGFQRRRARDLFIGHATQNPPDVVIWSLHRDSANGVHEFPLASVVGCDAAAGPATCSNVLGPNSFVIKHDVDFIAANNKTPKLNPCSHLRSDPRFIPNNICPAGSTVAEQFAILSPMPHEVQARTGAKIADLARAGGPILRTLDMHGAEAVNGQYLFPMGIGLGGVDPPTFAEIDVDLFDFPTSFSGIPWNMDRRLSPGGCIGPCEANPQPLNPFPFEGVTIDPRTQSTIPNVAFNDPNFTSSSLNSVANRILSFVSPATGKFDGNQTVLAWPPVDPGPQGIVVTPTLPGGGVFTPPLPQLSGGTPATGSQGTTVAVTLSGSNLFGGTGPVINAMPGITVTINTATASQIAATFVIAAAATPGPRSVSVTTDGGTSNVLGFTVTSSAPTLTTIAPVAGNDGVTVPVILTGTNLTGATLNAIAGVTVTVTATTATQINATFVIAANAAVGARNVTATTPGGTSNAVVFTVNAAAPTLTTIAPVSGNAGVIVPVILTGTNLTGGTVDAIAGVTVAITSTTPTQINAVFIIASNAAVGARNVTVTTASGTSNAVTFTVNAAVLPTLTSIAPISGNDGVTVPVVLTGTNLTSATVDAIPGVTVTVTSTTPTQINATFVIAANAAVGARNVTVTSPGGTSNAVVFTVNPAAPSLATIAPVTGNAGATVAVVLTGANLAGATVDAIAGVTVTVTATTATQINATFVIAANAAAGARNVTVTTVSGTSNPVTFTVNAIAGPTLTSIAPIAGNDGVTVPVVLTGTGLTGATINAIAGITITVQSTTATTVNATFAIAANAAVGARNVIVTTAGGASNAVVFTVNPAAPTLTSIAPTAGNDGVTVPVVLTGTNLAGATVDAIAGVTVTVTATTATTLNATFVIAANAAVGARNVTVTTAGGTSNAVVFTVNPAAPTLTSIAPTAGNDGVTVPVVLSGTNLAGATINAIAGITVTVQSTTATTVNATFVIAANAAVGARNVIVTTAGGTSNAVVFTVNPAAPTLTSIAPIAGNDGVTIPVVLTGTNLTGANIDAIAGVTVTITATTATQINATFAIAANAAVGARSVTVTTAGGTSNAVTFTVNAAASPTLTSIAPIAGNDGVTVPVVLTGTNLTGATINAIAGITVTVQSTTATTVNATFVIAANAAVGARSVAVTTAAGTSNAVTFTVNPAAPTLTSIAPVSGNVGVTVPVVLTGTNLAGATVNAIAGVTVTVTATTATQINATFAIAANAAAGARNVAVTTGGGTSNAAVFTVTLPAPTLASIAPVSGAAGTSVPVTITGTNLTGATVDAIAGVTITVTSTTATQINATFAIAANAAVGARNATVTTAGGTSNAVTFTVNAAAPAPATLTSIAPASGTTGTSVPVTITGTNLTGATLNLPAGITTAAAPTVTATQITATLVIAANATTGVQSISVTTAVGASNALTFTVSAPGAGPTIASMTPNPVSRATRATVTLTGANFTGAVANGVQFQLNGVTQNVVKTAFTVSPTQITFSPLFISGANGPGWTVTVTTAGGTSNAFAFTLNP